VLKAAEENDIDLSRSWFVGDILDDVECGRRAGCRTVLIDNGNETEWELSPLRRPHFMAPDLAARRLARGSRAPSHVLEMAFTSLLIPPLAVYWRLRGAIKYRVLFF
jgi:hypothetical protein